MNPKISFIIAAYNEELYLKECIDSCLNQTYENIEVCITDDGSTDSTINILNLYKDDSRINFYSFEKNKGKCSAYNKSYEIATGEYIAVIGADDVNYLDRIERQYQHLTDTNSDLVFSNYDFYYNDSKALKAGEKLRKPNKDSILYDNTISGGSILFNRTLSAKIFPIPEDLKFEDWWVAFHTVYFFKFSLIDFPSFKYRIHEKNTVGNIDDFLNNKRKNLMRHLRYHEYINKILVSVVKINKYIKINRFNLLYKKSILSDLFRERLVIFFNSFKFVTLSTVKRYPIFILLTIFGFRMLATIKKLLR